VSIDYFKSALPTKRILIGSGLISLISTLLVYFLVMVLGAASNQPDSSFWASVLLVGAFNLASLWSVVTCLMHLWSIEPVKILGRPITFSLTMLAVSCLLLIGSTWLLQWYVLAEPAAGERPLARLYEAIQVSLIGTYTLAGATSLAATFYMCGKLIIGAILTNKNDDHSCPELDQK